MAPQCELLAQHTMFCHLQCHPLGKKYPNLLKSWGVKRVTFWFRVQCFGIFTITFFAKNIQICWNLGASKGSIFGSAYNVLASLLSPSRWQISKFAEILEYQKGQLLAQRTMFCHLQYHSVGKKYQNLLKSWGDSKDSKTLYAEPKVDPFVAPRFQQIWIFFAMGVIVKTPKHRTLSQRLSLSMPQDFSKFWYFLPWGW